jgi:hypothetical protein
MGTSLPYMLASTVRRLAQPPWVVGALAMLSGYLGSWLARRPRYEAPGFRQFLRRYQWGAMLRGKRRTIARIERERAAVWRPDGGGAAG